MPATAGVSWLDVTNSLRICHGDVNDGAETRARLPDRRRVIAKGAMAILVALVVGGAAAAGQWVLLQQLAGVDPELRSMSVALPLLAAVVTAALRPRATSSEPVAAAPRAEPGPPPEPAEHAALRLLAFLQEEGRLIDFLSEDVSPYTDEQIGSATRAIHANCAKALRDVVTLERILPGAEDEETTVETGFDAGAVRLTGNVHGEPPFRGTLRHAGWRAARIVVPARAGVDPAVVAPAEVEIA
jgi:hypothetical protein